MATTEALAAVRIDRNRIVLGSVAVLVARIEQHLKENPKDSRGWEVIAPVYMRLGRYDDAVNARRNILSLLGPSAQREADLGVALAMVAGGEVTADSKAAFERAVGLDSGNVNASLSVSGPARRMPMSRLREIAPIIQEAGIRISRELGYQGPVGPDAEWKNCEPAAHGAISKTSQRASIQ